MAKQVMFGFTVDDVGYDGYSSEAHMVKLFDFFDELNIKATFFAVPVVKGVRLDQRPGYVAVLGEALQRGHEVAQHGLTHDRFEVGIPPDMILDLPHEKAEKQRLADNRAAIERALSVENIRRTLRQGREIIEAAVGQPIYGFRAPALQICDNLFSALNAEQYRYDSSIYLQPRSWDIKNGRASTPAPITRERFEQAQKPGAMLELPLTADYTWYLLQDYFDQYLDLARHDLFACTAAGIPWVNLAHVSPIQEGDDGLGFALYREVMSSAAQAGLEVQSRTLFDISEDIGRQSNAAVMG